QRPEWQPMGEHLEWHGREVFKGEARHWGKRRSSSNWSAGCRRCKVDLFRRFINRGGEFPDDVSRLCDGLPVDPDLHPFGIPASGLLLQSAVSQAPVVDDAVP